MTLDVVADTVTAATNFKYTYQLLASYADRWLCRHESYYEIIYFFFIIIIIRMTGPAASTTGILSRVDIMQLWTMSHLVPIRR